MQGLKIKITRFYSTIVWVCVPWHVLTNTAVIKSPPRTGYIVEKWILFLKDCPFYYCVFYRENGHYFYLLIRKTTENQTSAVGL